MNYIVNFFFNIRKIIVILLVLTLLIVTYIYFSTNYIIIRFNELGALNKNMPVFYNGFRIGKIVRIEPDNDFQHTLVKVNLNYKNLDLPQNITVGVRSFPNGELYLQFLYPESPSLKFLKKGDMIEGIATYNLEEFMLGQNVSGVSDLVSIHVIKALKATEIANHEMQNFFKNSSDIMKDNGKGISKIVNNAADMTESLAQMAYNLDKTTESLNKALSTQTLTATTANIKTSSSNIKDATSNIMETTQNIAKATEDLDKTIGKIDDTIAQVNEAAANVNDISSGLKMTLNQRFAGMRILFGAPVKNKKYKNACR